METPANRATLSIVVPVYNEEDFVAKLLDKVYDAPLSLAKELIIVDDGSRDASAQAIKAWLAAHPDTSGFKTKYLEKPNGGKGSAVKLGIANSSGEVLIIQDADLEYDPRDYEACVKPILEGRAKVVYGSREASNRNRIYSAPTFYLGGLSLTLWVNLLFGTELSDEPTCYKTFDGPLIRSLPIEGDKFDWEPEVTAKLARLGFEILEVPIAYYPRPVDAGKKIKWTDGLEGFWVSFKWRFLPLGSARAALSGAGGELALSVSEGRKAFNALLLVLGVAFIARLLFALPGLSDPSLLMRPDSSSYLQPALAMLSDWAFNTAPGSGEPMFGRTPGYPFFLAALLKLGGGSLAFCAFASILLGALVCLPVFLCGRYFGSWRIGFWAALLLALNPTAIAFSPMFLSDTLFLFVISTQLLFLLRYLKTWRIPYAFAFGACAGLGALIRPLNLYWTFPAIIFLLLAAMPWRRRCCGVAILVAMALLFALPWMFRNERLGCGMRLDTIAGDSGYYHNSAILIGKLEGVPASTARERLHDMAEAEFAAKPEAYSTEGSRAAWKERRFMELVKAHPYEYAKLMLRPYTLIPDVPSLLENMGLTKGGRNTFDVLNKKGVFAALESYFDGKYWLIALAAPLLFIAGFTYLLACGRLFEAIRSLDYRFVLLFLLCAVFYVFIPNPVTMPRYQLPALPLLSLMAGWTLLEMGGWLRAARPRRIDAASSTSGDSAQ